MWAIAPNMASIGPVAGRIAGASFELNGQTHHSGKPIMVLTANHSGPTGWDSLVYVESVTDQKSPVHRACRWYRWFPWESQDLGNLWFDGRWWTRQKRISNNSSQIRPLFQPIWELHPADQWPCLSDQPSRALPYPSVFLSSDRGWESPVVQLKRRTKTT